MKPIKINNFANLGMALLLRQMFELRERKAPTFPPGGIVYDNGSRISWDMGVEYVQGTKAPVIWINEASEVDPDQNKELRKHLAERGPSKIVISEGPSYESFPL